MYLFASSIGEFEAGVSVFSSIKNVKKIKLYVPSAHRNKDEFLCAIPLFEELSGLEIEMANERIAKILT